jgi:hypothetical protein
MWGDGYGVSRPDLYVTSLMDFHRGWRTRANELSETTFTSAALLLRMSFSLSGMTLIPDPGGIERRAAASRAPRHPLLKNGHDGHKQKVLCANGFYSL